MKYFFLFVFTLSFSYQSLWAQKNQNLNLKNVLIVAQQNDLSDRYSLEVALIQMFSYYNVKCKASLNVVKEGGSPDILLNDSIRQKLKDEGIDTYLLVSIRGFDRRYQPADSLNDFKDEIDVGHLFPLYRESASNVTFNFTFYRDLKPVYYDMIRVKGISSKDDVIKKLLKAVEKELTKSWMK